MENVMLLEYINDGDNFVKANCPELYKLLTRQCQHGMHSVNKRQGNTLTEEEELNAGLQDMTEIQDISYDAESRMLKAKSVAGFNEKKGVIAIISEVFDSNTGESVKGSAVTLQNTHSLTCDIESIMEKHNLTKDSRFFVRSTFYWTDTDESGNVVMKSREERMDSGMVYDGGEEIVKNITVEFPNTIKPREYTIILYNRNAEQHVEDPDKVYPNVAAHNNILPFYMPFTGSVKIGAGKIAGGDKDKSVIRLMHPEKKTEVRFNKDKSDNWKDIKWVYQSGNTILHWEFPENWRNDLSLKDLSVSGVFDFYAQLVLNVILVGTETPIPIPITIGSNVEQDNTHCKVKQVFLQWGCLGESTRILMGDGRIKKICEIKVGETVNTGKSHACVKGVYAGIEKEIVHIITERGKHLMATAGHPVLTERGWKRTNELNAADKVATANETFERLTGLYVANYNDKVYSLELESEDRQLIAEEIIVGDFLRQNQMPADYDNHSFKIKGQEKIAAEFKLLVDAINRQHHWGDS